MDFYKYIRRDDIIMRLNKYILNELTSGWGLGFTAVDIDETLFKTFAKIYVMKDGEIVQKLNNQEFNVYKLKNHEFYDFREFRDAEFFRKTSIPIPKTINRVKRMMKYLDVRGSKIIFLTARADFNDKKIFLQTFRDYGIPIDNIYVERAGNDKTGTVSSIKKKIILRYLNTGLYRRVRLIDDCMANVKEFLDLQYSIPQNIIDKVKERYNITGEESIPVIEFFGLLVKDDGSLVRIR